MAVAAAIEIGPGAKAPVGIQAQSVRVARSEETFRSSWEPLVASLRTDISQPAQILATAASGNGAGIPTVTPPGARPVVLPALGEEATTGAAPGSVFSTSPAPSSLQGNESAVGASSEQPTASSNFKQPSSAGSAPQAFHGNQPSAMNPGQLAENSNSRQVLILGADASLAKLPISVQEKVKEPEEAVPVRSRGEKEVESSSASSGKQGTNKELVSTAAPALPLNVHAAQALPLPENVAQPLPPGPAAQAAPFSANGATAVAWKSRASHAASILAPAVALQAHKSPSNRSITPAAASTPISFLPAAAPAVLPAAAPTPSWGAGIAETKPLQETPMREKNGAEASAPQWPEADSATRGASAENALASHGTSPEKTAVVHRASPEIVSAPSGALVAVPQTGDDSHAASAIDESAQTSAAGVLPQGPSQLQRAIDPPLPARDLTSDAILKRPGIPLGQSSLKSVRAADSGPRAEPVSLRAPSPTDTTSAGNGSDRKGFSQNERESNATTPNTQNEFAASAHSAAGLQNGFLLTRNPGEVSSASSLSGQPASSAALDSAAHDSAGLESSASSRDAFAAIDAAPAAVSPTWVHAGAQRAEAGYQDPALGWVSVRADLGGGSVHASLVPGSSDAATALGSHLAGLNTFLAEHHSQVATVTLAAPEARSGETGIGQNSGQGGGRETNADAQQGMGQSPQHGSGNAPLQEANSDTQRGETADGSGDALEGTIHAGSVNGQPMVAGAAGGVHISVMA
jgi:hypothetical protein